MEFTHLHTHSNYSYGIGGSSNEDLIRQAKELGYKRLAITDKNTIAGTVEFYSICKELSIQPIIGCKIDDDTPDPRHYTILLCQSDLGYKHLCEILTRKKLDDTFDLIGILQLMHQGLFILTPSTSLINNLKNIPNVYGELILTESNRQNNRAVFEFCREHRIPSVLSNAVCFATPADYEKHQTLSAIKNLSTVFEEDLPVADQQQYLKPPDAMLKLGRSIPESIINTQKIAARCFLDFELRKYHCARYIGTDGRKLTSRKELLRKIVYAGLQKRYFGTESENIVQLSMLEKYKHIMQRVEYELEVITNLNYEDYFLICWDIVNYARSQGIWHVGRGSAANSIVSYCLEITEVDPLRYNLYFERFMNYARGSPPDIDIDFSWRYRDFMLNYIYNRYGKDHVAMLSAINTFRARGALREVAKAHGISERELNSFMKMVPRTRADNLPMLQQNYPEAKNLQFDGKLFDKIISIAAGLNGYPNYSGIHASGVVITEKPITYYSATLNAVPMDL